MILPVDGLYEFEGASAETASGFVNRILVQATDRSPEAIGELARWVDGSRPFSAVKHFRFGARRTLA